MRIIAFVCQRETDIVKLHSNNFTPSGVFSPQNKVSPWLDEMKLKKNE